MDYAMIVTSLIITSEMENIFVIVPVRQFAEMKFFFT